MATASSAYVHKGREFPLVGRRVAASRLVTLFKLLGGCSLNVGRIPRSGTMVNVLELERLALPITSFALTVFSAAFSIVALATPSWVEVSYVPVLCIREIYTYIPVI